MKKLIFMATCLLPLAASAAPLDERIAHDVQAGLPVGLAVVRVIAPSREVADSTDVRVIWHGPPHAGMASVEVDVEGPHGAARPTLVWARVELGEVHQVLVAARHLNAGERIAATDVIEDARAGRGLAFAPAAVAGALVKHDVPIGVTIGESDLSLPPPVPRGTAITVEIRRGAVRISAPGTLETAALPGARAVARVAGREITGRLTAEHTLVVEGDAR